MTTLATGDQSSSSGVQSPSLLPKLSRRNCKYTRRVRIGRLLSKFGLRFETNGFWDKPRTELEWILEDARKNYKVMRIKMHPRSLADDGTSAADLNESFLELEDRFHYKFHPQLIPRSVIQPNRPRPERHIPKSKLICHHCETPFLGPSNKRYCGKKCRKVGKNAYARKVYWERKATLRVVATP